MYGNMKITRENERKRKECELTVGLTPFLFVACCRCRSGPSNEIRLARFTLRQTVIRPCADAEMHRASD